MAKFIIGRLLQAIPTLFIIAGITFFMTRMAPGGPFDDEKQIDKDIKKEIEAHYGLDRSLLEQFLLYLGTLRQEVNKTRVEFDEGEQLRDIVTTDANATLRVHRNGKVEVRSGKGSWHSRLNQRVHLIQFDGNLSKKIHEKTITFKHDEKKQEFVLEDSNTTTTLLVSVDGKVVVTEGNGKWLGRRAPPEVVVFQIGERAGLLQGDFGPSFKYVGWEVSELIAQAFPVSAQLGLCSLAIALALGLPAGIVAALRKNSPWDYVPMSIAMVGICLPTFVLGPALILLFSTKLGWFSPMGWYATSDIVLPSLTLGLFYAAYIARLTRAGMLETLNQDYIRTARAKGAPPAQVVTKHALRGGLLPVVTFLGPAFAGLISGSFIIETIFFIPGLGRFFVTAAFNRDYTMVLGTVLFYATLIILLNLLVDVIQAALDPKARNQ